MKNKKAQQLNMLYSAIILFIVIGILLAVAFIINANFQSAVSDKITAYNDTLTSNVSTLRFAPVYSITEVRNGSCTGTVLAEGNYSLSGNVLTISPTGTVIQPLNNTGAWCTTYQYEGDSKSGTVLNQTTTSLASISSDWLGIIILVIVMGIILSLIVGSFFMYNKRS